MGQLSAPQIFVDIFVAKYPASLGTTVVRLTQHERPKSFTGQIYQPRITDISSIERAATDQDGNYEVGQFRIRANDSDGFLSTLLDTGEPTEYWNSREVRVTVISREGLALGLTPATVTPVARGFITDVQRKAQQVTIQVSDALGSQFSGYNLDKKVLQLGIKHLTTNYRPENADVKLPIYIGEFSDIGSPPLDDGTETERGLLPVHEVCEVDITDLTGTPIQTFADPPVITGSGVVGTSGQKTYYYAASLITPLGETALGNIVSVNGASSRDRFNYNWIEGTYDNGGASPYNTVRIWRSDDGVSWTYWMDEANYFLPEGSFGYADGAKPVTGPSGTGVTDNEEEPYRPLTPSTGTAGTNTNIWSVMAVCLGYGYEFLKIYASDLAFEAEPRLRAITIEEHGVTIITPDDPEWPYPDPWIEMNGIIFTGFLVQGPKLNHHRDGTVRFGVNLCGPHGANGKVINQAWPAMQFLLNEHCVHNKGTGYRNHTYGTLETYENGDPVIKPTSFEDCQELSKTYMLDDEHGYLAAIAINDPEETWRDVVRKFCQTFGARFATNRFGQIVAILVNTEHEDNSTEGRHFRERIEIKRFEDFHMAHDQILNQFNISYFYDPAAHAYRGTGVVVRNLESIAAHVPGGVVGSDDLRGVRERDLEMAYTADEATMYDVANRELLRRKRRPIYPVIAVPLLGLDYDLGDRARLSSARDGLGPAGYDSVPCLILRHGTNLMDREVLLTLQDRRTITIGANESIGDEVIGPTADMIGDEQSVPPTALEVG